MLSQLTSFTTHGIDALPVSVEVGVIPTAGEPKFQIVGLGDTAVQESKQRVAMAMKTSGYRLPMGRITSVNLAPAHLRKAGSRYDLPIALGILASSGAVDIPEAAFKSSAFLGELALVGGAKHPHVWDGAHERDVVDRLVGRAVGVGQEAGHASEKHRRQARDAEVVADELVCAQREEGRERVANRAAATQREASGDADHRLFADPDVDEAFAEDGRERANGGAIFGCQHDDAVVLFSERAQGFFVARGRCSGGGLYGCHGVSAVSER